jgi:hypothetical protein
MILAIQHFLSVLQLPEKTNLLKVYFASLWRIVIIKLLADIATVDAIEPLFNSIEEVKLSDPWNDYPWEKEELIGAVVSALKKIRKRNKKVCDDKIFELGQANEDTRKVLIQMYSKRELSKLESIKNIKFSFKYGCPDQKETPVHLLFDI